MRKACYSRLSGQFASFFAVGLLIVGVVIEKFVVQLFRPVLFGNSCEGLTRQLTVSRDRRQEGGHPRTRRLLQQRA